MTVAGAGAAGVVCWAGWGVHHWAGVQAVAAFSSLGNSAADPSGQTWGENLVLAWEPQGSPVAPCGTVEGRIAGCTLGAFGLTSWRGPVGTGLAPATGSETVNNDEMSLTTYH